MIKNQRKSIVKTLANNPYRTKTPDSEYLISNDGTDQKNKSSHADKKNGDAEFSYNTKSPPMKNTINPYLNPSTENLNQQNLFDQNNKSKKPDSRELSPQHDTRTSLNQSTGTLPNDTSKNVRTPKERWKFAYDKITKKSVEVNLKLIFLSLNIFDSY